MKEGRGRRQILPTPFLPSFQQTSGKWLAPSFQFKHFSSQKRLRWLQTCRNVHYLHETSVRASPALDSREQNCMG
jgi:hypothetical protein